MAAYWLSRCKVNDPVEYKKYTDLVPGIIAKYGGKVLARGGKYQIMEGTDKFHRFVVIEFPTLEQAVNKLATAPAIAFDTTLETIPLLERIRRLREAEERLAAQRAAGVSQRANIEKSVHEKLELATLSSKKGLFLDAAELIADAVSELAVGWTQASPSALLPDLIRDAREGLLTLKTACAAEQQFAKSRNAPAVKCP